MPNDAPTPSDQLLELAATLRQKTAEAETIRKQIRTQFADPVLAPLVKAVLGDEYVERQPLLSDIGTNLNTALARSFAVVGFILVLMLIVSALLLYSSGEVPGTVAAAVGGAVVIVLAITGVSFIAIAFFRSVTDFGAFWQQVEKVLQSGVFYFFAGLCLLLYAIHATNAQEHPSLTFLIAMLGVAIMLFGTGSQAAGAIATAGARLPHPSEAGGIAAAGGAPADAGAANVPADHPAAVSESSVKDVAKAIDDGMAKPAEADKAAALAGLVELGKKAVAAAERARAAAVRPVTDGGGDWGPVKANAAIAGGAAVLTALFGWGVIHYSPEIRQVFADHDRYQRIVIEACVSPNDPTCDGSDTNRSNLVKALTLEHYVIKVETANGTQIHTARRDRELTLLAFSRELREDTTIILSAKRVAGVQRLDFDDNIDVSFAVGQTQVKADGTAARKAACLGEGTGTCKLACREPVTEGRIKTARCSLNFYSGAGSAVVVRSINRVGEDGKDVSRSVELQ